MTPSLLTTWYAQRTRSQAWLILGFTGAAMVGCLFVAFSPAPAAGEPQSGGRDLELYEAIVSRVHDGESYYAAAARELPIRGYTTGSIFNWRTPLYAWLFGKLPSPRWGQALLVAGCLAVMLLAYSLMKREAVLGMAFFTMILLFGAFEWSVDDLFAKDPQPAKAFLATEVWSAMLIALSICLYANDLWIAGTAVGLLALFFRELALPYCVLCLAWACWRKRRWEIVLWLAGFALYGAFFALHARAVSEELQAMVPSGAAHKAAAGDWIQFGGLSMILATAKMNYFLVAAPRWATALFLPLALLGLGGWQTPTGRRVGLTVVLYLAAFAVAGKPYNDYWGILYAPLLALGFVWSPLAIRDLIRIIKR